MIHEVPVAMVVLLEVMGWLLLVLAGLVVGMVIRAGVLSRQDRRNRLETLAQTRCLYCNSHYGMAAAQEAERGYLEACQRKRDANPDLRFRFFGIWTVWCPNCDKSCGYASGKRELVPTPKERAQSVVSM